MRPLAKELLKQWQESHPKLVEQLKKSGELDQAIEARVERYLDVYSESVEKGLNPDQARELARQEFEMPPPANAPGSNPPTTE